MALLPFDTLILGELCGFFREGCCTIVVHTLTWCFSLKFSNFICCKRNLCSTGQLTHFIRFGRCAACLHHSVWVTAVFRSTHHRVHCALVLLCLSLISAWKLSSYLVLWTFNPAVHLGAHWHGLGTGVFYLSLISFVSFKGFLELFRLKCSSQCCIH